jgi:hypothetical protein
VESNHRLGLIRTAHRHSDSLAHHRTICTGSSGGPLLRASKISTTANMIPPQTINVNSYSVNPNPPLRIHPSLPRCLS